MTGRDFQAEIQAVCIEALDDPGEHRLAVKVLKLLDEYRRSTQPINKAKNDRKHSREVHNYTEAMITYLNLQTGRSFRTDSEKTRRMISALMSKGATLAMMKDVVDVKVRDWKGDPTMDKFLRPNTLFRASNFWQYHEFDVGTTVPREHRPKGLFGRRQA